MVVSQPSGSPADPNDVALRLVGSGHRCGEVRTCRPSCPTSVSNCDPRSPTTGSSPLPFDRPTSSLRVTTRSSSGSKRHRSIRPISACCSQVATRAPRSWPATAVCPQWRFRSRPASWPPRPHASGGRCRPATRAEESSWPPDRRPPLRRCSARSSGSRRAMPTPSTGRCTSASACRWPTAPTRSTPLRRSSIR